MKRIRSSSSSVFHFPEQVVFRKHPNRHLPQISAIGKYKIIEYLKPVVYTSNFKNINQVLKSTKNFDESVVLYRVSEKNVKTFESLWL